MYIVHVHDVIGDVERKKERKTPEANGKMNMRVATCTCTCTCSILYNTCTCT